MTLDPAGLNREELRERLAQAFDNGSGPDYWAADHALACFDAELARAAAVPPTTENPYPRGAGHGFNAQAWDEGFVAGRAAATETIPREDALQALHEMSTVAGLLRVRRDDPAVVALGDRLRLACCALRDVTAPGMNELMDSQPGRAAATPTFAERWERAHPDYVPPPPAATPDPPTSDEFTEAAWGLIANAYGGNWSEAPDEWHGAAARWRDEYVAGAVAAPPAASPDERLREALDDAMNDAADLLAAADREKPETDT